MALTERLQILVTADGKGAVNEFSRIGATAEKELGRTDDRLKRLSSGLVANGTQIAVAGGLATAGIFALAKASGDYEEAASAAGVIFGDSAEAIEDFGTQAIKTAGLSRRAAVEAANTFGTFGKAAGLTGDDLADFSTELTQLAGDLASFKNTSTEDAILAIGAALRGESEPIRRYGVLLDDATLKAKAMELGIYDGIGALDQQSKVLAAQAVILQQTSDAQGDFARTSDSLSNQTRSFTAEIENLKVGLGQGAVPVFSELVGAANDALSSFQNLSPETQTLVGRIGAIAALGTTAVGGLTVLAGGALRVVDTFRDMGGRLRDADGNLTRVGQTARITGAALGAAGLTFAVYEVAKAFNEATRDIVGLDTAINNLRTADIGSTDFDRFIAEGAGDTAGTIDDLSDAFFRLTTAGRDVGKVNIGEFTVQIDDLTRYLDRLYTQDPQQLERVLDRLGNIEELRPDGLGAEAAAEFDNLANKVDDYRENLESASKSTKTGFEQFRGGIDLYRQATEQAADATDDLASSVDKANAEVDLAAALFGRAADRAKGFLGAIEDSSAIDDLLGASLDLRDSSAALLDGVGALAGVDVQQVASGFGKISAEATEALRDVLAVGEDAQASIAAALQFQGADVARAKANDIRDGLVGVLDAAGVADDQIQYLLETIGLADWQIEASITVAGEAEARATIDAFQKAAELLEAPIEIQAQVAQAQLEGRLTDAKNLIDIWVQDRQDGLLNDPLLVAMTLGDTTAASGAVDAWKGGEEAKPPAEIPVDADTNPANESLNNLRSVIPLFGGAVKVTADTSQAIKNLQQLQQAIPIFGTGAGIRGGFDVKIPNRAVGGAVNAGGDYFVNEPALGGELFRPSTNGFVMNAADTDRLLRGVESLVGGGGGNTYNISVQGAPSPMATAEEIILAARAERHLVGV